MQITKQTKDILANFSKINPSIIISKGNVLRTVSSSKTILARAEVDVNFDRDFAIYSLDRFLSTLSLYEKPELNFGEKTVIISENNRTTEYVYANPDTINKPPAKDIVLPSVEAKFVLKSQALKDVEKAASVLSLPEISIKNEKGSVIIQAFDSKNPSGDTYSVHIDEHEGKDFNAIFKLENLKLLQNDYEVNLSSKGISMFKSLSEQKVTYWVAIEQNSTF